MIGFFVIAIMVMAVVAGVYYFIRSRLRANRIARIVTNPLVQWSYNPQEWQRAIADELTWGKADGGPVQIIFSATGIYFKGASFDHLINLNEGGIVVTHASYRGTAESPLKIRVRWKVRTSDDETKFYKEDYRIPVPLREKDAAQQVVNFLIAQRDRNPNAYTSVMPDDEPISLFGNDSF